jgi:hypothetical protein
MWKIIVPKVQASMTSRFAIAIGLASILVIYPSVAQQLTSDVVISGASIKDGYMGGSCDDEGHLYLRPVNARPRPSGKAMSLLRVAKDGSTLLFTLPEPQWSIGVFAPTATGLSVLNNSYTAAEGIYFHMYRFDWQAKLQTERAVAIDFQPVAMAETASGLTIVVGHRPRIGTDKEVRTYGGAILDANDQVAKVFEFPSTADGNKWTTVQFPRMAGGNGVAYIMLESVTESRYAIATIAESGQTGIIPLATVGGERFHDWFFGKSVAVEQYQFSGQKPPGATNLDSFDLASGKKIDTKTLIPVGFSVACYLGDSVSMLAHSAHVEKSRGLSPDALRLVTVKLE